MAVAVVMATSISKILLEGLKVAERVLDIRKKSEEIKALKLNNKKIAQEIETEAESAKKDGIQNILNAVIKDFKLKANEQGDKIIALERSIKNLVEFTEKGGVVDFVQTTEKENVDVNIRNELNKLSVNISEIRLLENKMKMIEQ